MSEMAGRIQRRFEVNNVKTISAGEWELATNIEPSSNARLLEYIRRESDITSGGGNGRRSNLSVDMN